MESLESDIRTQNPDVKADMAIRATVSLEQNAANSKVIDAARNYLTAYFKDGIDG
jgi:hypothetical protein